MKDSSLTNGSSDVLDTSRGSVGTSRSGADVSKLSLNDSSSTISPGRIIPSPAERAILSKVNSQEVLLKNVLSQQEKLLDTHRILMQEILANRGSIDTLKSEMVGLKSSVAEVKAFAGALGTMTAKLNDINESQKELRDIVYELNLANYNEDEGDYEDVEEEENRRPTFEPISPALHVSTLPSFGHMNISGLQPSQPGAQNNMNKTPNQSVFSRLGEKSSTPLASPATAPTASTGSIVLQKPSFGKNQPSPQPGSILAAPAFTFGQAKPTGSPAVQPSTIGFGAKPGPASSKPANEKEVEVVYEKTPSSDLIKKAESLELPKNFYNYIDKPDCQGCRGCEKEGTVTVTSTIASLSSTTATTASNAAPKTTSIFGGGSSKPLFGGATSAATVSKASTGTASTTSTVPASTAPASTGTLFGKPATVSSEKPFSFGFQLNTSATPSGPLFGAKDTQSSAVDQPKSVLLPSFGSSAATGSDAPKFTFGFSNTSSAFGGSTSSGTGLFSAAVKETVGADCANSGFKWGGNADGSKPSWMVDTPSQIFGQKVCSPNEEDENEENPEEGMSYFSLPLWLVIVNWWISFSDSVDDSCFVLPTVELPDQVEIKTGEEDEDIVYCQRGKLFRYDQPTKQWKERGIGDLKILKHQKVPSK